MLLKALEVYAWISVAMLVAGLVMLGYIALRDLWWEERKQTKRAKRRYKVLNRPTWQADLRDYHW